MRQIEDYALLIAESIRVRFPPAVDDADIGRLVKSIEAATAAGQWETVRELNASLRDALKKRAPVSADHARGLSRSNAAFTAIKTLEEGGPAGPLLAAFAADQRFGSLRAYATARGINRASLSAYARGRSPVPPEIDKMVRKDFPGLAWKWPAGVSTRRKPSVERAVARFQAGDLDMKAAAREAGLSVSQFMDALDKRSVQR